MHRPDAAAHRHRRSAEPSAPGPTRGGADAACKVEGGVGRGDSNRDGEGDEGRVVRPGQGVLQHCSHYSDRFRAILPYRSRTVSGGNWTVNRLLVAQYVPTRVMETG